MSPEPSIDRFIDRFKIIKKLTVVFIDRNDEIDGGNIFESLHARVKPMHPSSAKAVINGGGGGLEPVEVKKFVVETTKGGYEEVRLSGPDIYGNELNGSNDDFVLKADIPDNANSDAQMAVAIERDYQLLKAERAIVVSPKPDDVEGKISAILAAVAKALLP